MDKKNKDISNKEKKSSFKELDTLYKQEKEIDKIDIKNLNAKRSLHYLKFIAISIIGAFLIWMGLFYYTKTPQFKNQNVFLSISGPDKALTGELITYSITLENKEAVNLKETTLSLYYPSTFEIISYNYQPTTKNNIWDLNNFSSNNNTTIEITGKIISQTPSTNIISAIASYTPENFSSTFNKNTSTTTYLLDPDISFNITSEKHTTFNKEFDYIISITNDNDFTLENIKITALYPEYFVKTKTHPEETINETTFQNITHNWIIDTLQPKQNYQIKITGSLKEPGLNEKINFDQVFNAQLAQKSLNNNFIVYKKEEITTTLRHNNLSTTLEINGSEFDSSINIQDNLEYKINLKNFAKNKFNNNIIELRIYDFIDEEHLIDIENININKNIEFNENTEENYLSFIWHYDNFNNLKKIDLLEELTLSLDLPFNKQLPADKLVDAQIINKLFTFTQIPSDDNIPTPKTIESTPIINTLLSDFSVNTKIQYYDKDNNQLGSGPMPPKIGEKTSYQVTWEIKNTLHDIKNIKVSSLLQKNTEWQGQYNVNIGKINYNKKTKLLSWTIEELPKEFSNPQLQFYIGFIPKEKDKNTVPQLTGKIYSSAYDTKLDKLIELSTPALDTNLKGDPQVENMGVVVE